MASETLVSVSKCLTLPNDKRINIEFFNISCSVRVGRKEKKELLHDVSGKFKSGELTAILGPSGAGKSTLLNILTGFHTRGMKGLVQGISVQTGVKVSHKLKSQSCYILQDDQLNPLFTVSEIMTIAANFKIGYGMTDKNKQILINSILETLSLSVCKQTRCARLSGGQKKRLSIALELIDNPPIMFLDEPTTGLDSLSTLQCISTLKSLAREGRTIVCTIHQPSATIFEMFDHIYVIADGYCIYTGSANNTVPYLSEMGLHCPQYHNPADFLLEVANGDYGNFIDPLVIYSKKRCNTNEISIKECQENEKMEKQNINFRDSMRPPSELIRFSILLNRTGLQLYRDWTVTHLRLALHTMIGILLGLLYLNYGSDGSKTLANIGYFIITSVYLNYTSLMPAVVKFPLELPVLKKEIFNNWYKLKTYYAAFLLAHIPIQVVYSLAYASVSYFLSAQPADLSRFLMFVLVCCLLSISAEGLGTILGTTVNPVNGTFLGAVMTAFMISVSGFICFFSHMPKPLYLVSYLSYMSYSVEALTHAVYGFDREALPCPSEELYCHYRVPEVALKEVGMYTANYWYDVSSLFIAAVLFRIVAFYTLRNRLSSK